MSNQTVFIIDTYSRFEQDNIIDIFSINSHWYAIKKVQLNFGKPILSNIEKNEDNSLYFHIYESLDDARKYVRQIKHLEGVKF